ncbi:hypothetical protein POVWA2_014350 [Plasmodium ovale wallikeri]|uniref:Uncharacterized protein n=1 Tax=Plasmodium ovale wallikeri TaxID=864142 RepID=A0A1A8YP39_PLAOA|nr:hypothetical protein POVWA1_014510 [Plasmodium ovale wallikeri]SBT33362.1 hypothetical protein POVWA2_014350 [Plasmodium ovale wallikeri]
MGSDAKRWDATQNDGKRHKTMGSDTKRWEATQNDGKQRKTIQNDNARKAAPSDMKKKVIAYGSEVRKETHSLSQVLKLRIRLHSKRKGTYANASHPHI